MKKPMMFLVVLALLGLLCSSAQAQSWSIGAPLDEETLDEDDPVNAFGDGPENGVAWLEVTRGSVCEGGWVYVDNFSYWWVKTVNPPSGGWGGGAGYVTLWSDSDPATRNMLAQSAVTFTWW